MTLNVLYGNESLLKNLGLLSNYIQFSFEMKRDSENLEILRFDTPQYF